MSYPVASDRGFEMIRTIGSRLDAGFDVYQIGLFARTQVETRRIKEVRQ